MLYITRNKNGLWFLRIMVLCNAWLSMKSSWGNSVSHVLMCICMLQHGITSIVFITILYSVCFVSAETSMIKKSQKRKQQVSTSKRRTMKRKFIFPQQFLWK
eukprot:PhF_6_TR7995/c1_g2_i1/m.12298